MNHARPPYHRPKIVNELSLFSGAGGGLLGTKLLGFRPIGYVEWDGYCQAVLAQRIRDGFLEEAPIFGDIREFVKSGAAREYRGFADVVTAGFPCQPHSVAGKQLGADDPRDMWPATRDVIREAHPGIAWLENVPGLITSGYLGIVLADLAALGYSARWGVFSCAADGGPQVRARVFVLAHAGGEGGEGLEPRGSPGVTGPWRWSGEADMQQLASFTFFGSGRWPQPLICGMDDGLANRLDRLKASGNGQVPSVVVRAWQELTK